MSHVNICFLGARSLRSLAQYKYIYFLSVQFGVLPPQYQKAGYATGGLILTADDDQGVNHARDEKETERQHDAHDGGDQEEKELRERDDVADRRQQEFSRQSGEPHGNHRLRSLLLAEADGYHVADLAGRRQVYCGTGSMTSIIIICTALVQILHDLTLFFL